VAVINQDGEVLANRNVPNGIETILSVIGGLPTGTPAAFEAAFGWGWLVELLEDYGFDLRRHGRRLVHPGQCRHPDSGRHVEDVEHPPGYQDHVSFGYRQPPPRHQLGVAASKVLPGR
jgi:transposase